MKRERFEAKDLQDRDYGVEIIDSPDFCPLCHFSNVPKRISSVINYSENLLQIVYQCNNKDCQNLFISYYRRQMPDGYYYMYDLKPINPKEEEFSKEIKNISENFLEIYNQAIEAESLNLDEIAGIGFRKAIEFLVKDFAVSYNPDDEEKIKKMFLNKCIEKYIDDQKLKESIKRAAWLGNDEVHYYRKWETHDIKDLKILIRLAINAIENILLLEKYKKDMPED